MILPLRFLSILAIPDDAKISSTEKTSLSYTAHEVSKLKSETFEQMHIRKRKSSKLVDEYNSIVHPDYTIELDNIFQLRQIYHNIYEVMGDCDNENSITGNYMYFDYICNNALDDFEEVYLHGRMKKLLMAIDTSYREIAEPLLKTIVPLNEFEKIIVQLLERYFKLCSEFLKEINDCAYSWKPSDVLEITRQRMKMMKEHSDLENYYFELGNVRSKIDKLRHQYVPDICKSKDEWDSLYSLDFN